MDTETSYVMFATFLLGALAAGALLWATCRMKPKKNPDKSPRLHRPHIVRGKHAISSTDFMKHVENHFAHNLRGHKTNPVVALKRARAIANGVNASMGIETRYMARPIEKALGAPLTPQQQKEWFVRVGLDYATEAIQGALKTAVCTAGDVSCIIFVSHVPFPFPPLTSHLSSRFKFSPDCVHIPVTSMGCAGGGFALGVARDYCLAHPSSTVLILSVEMCSVGFRPHKSGMSWFLNAALFGDAAAACVVRGVDVAVPKNAEEVKIVVNKQRHVHGTTDVSYFEYDQWGYHFITTKALRDVVKANTPRFAKDLAHEAFGRIPRDLDAVIIHPGGAGMIADLVKKLRLKGSSSEAAAYASMRNGGNLASATVLDMLSANWETVAKKDSESIVVGMGPGFIMAGVALCGH